VVVGGDSHSLLGSDLTEVVAGRSTIGPYATVIEKGDGTKTCVVQAWDYSKLISMTMATLFPAVDLLCFL